jgi:hypothetical protein
VIDVGFSMEDYDSIPATAIGRGLKNGRTDPRTRLSDPVNQILVVKTTTKKRKLTNFNLFKFNNIIFKI